MKKLVYILPIMFSIVIFSGCHKQEANKSFTCTPWEKENQFCNYDLNPVCWDDWETYWNACIACSSNNIDSYKMWECQICDDEKWVCSIWDMWEDDFNYDMDISNQDIQEVYIDVPTPNFQ